ARGAHVRRTGLDRGLLAWIDGEDRRRGAFGHPKVDPAAVEVVALELEVDLERAGGAHHPAVGRTSLRAHELDEPVRPLAQLGIDLDGAAIRREHLADGPNALYLSVLKPSAPLAGGFDGGEVVGHEDEGRALAEHVLDPL